MNIDKNQLLIAMKKAMPGVDKGSSLIDGADTFLLTGDFIHTYNDTVSVSAPCKMDGLAGSVKCLDLFRLVSKLATPLLQINQLDGKWELLAGRVKATIQLVESQTGKYLEGLKLSALEWKELPENFNEGVKLTRIPRNASPFRGICVDKNVMISTDQVQMNRFILQSTMDTFWIDEAAIGDYVKFNPGAVAYAISEAWVHFKMADGTIFSARRKEHSEYPFEQIDTIIAERVKKETDSSNVLPADIGEVADRVATLAADQKGSLPVRLTLDKANLSVYAERPTGNITEEVPWEKPFETDPKLAVWIDSLFLVEAAVRKSMAFHISVDDGGVAWVVFTGEGFMQVAGSIAMD